MFEDPNCYAHG